MCKADHKNKRRRGEEEADKRCLLTCKADHKNKRRRGKEEAADKRCLLMCKADHKNILQVLEAGLCEG